MDTAELLDAETAIELESDDLDPPDSDPSEFEVNTSLFGKINIRAAETLLLNGGKTTFGAKERAGRFYKNPYTASTSEIKDYNTSTPCLCTSALKKGDTATLQCHRKGR